MLPIVWLDEAEDALDVIVDFVIQYNPVAAWQLEMQITDATQLLAAFPYMGRLGRVLGTRELWPHPNYCVIYVVKSDCIEISAVLHARREYP